MSKDGAHIAEGFAEGGRLDAGRVKELRADRIQDGVAERRSLMLSRPSAPPS